MNSTDLIDETEKQSEFYRRLRIAATIGFITILTGAIVVWLAPNNTEVERDPPPIIIKSGSFIIDSVDGFKDQGDVTGSTKRKKVNQYKGDFGDIKEVLVNQVNERFASNISPKRPFSYYYLNSSGIIIQLWFQKIVSENPEQWDLDDVDGEPDVITRVSSENSKLELELPADLSKSNENKHHKRKNKDKLDFKKDASGTDRYFRIGRIKILRKSDGKLIKEFNSINGDEYYISLWSS
jgi:hypothetical protein